MERNEFVLEAQEATSQEIVETMSQGSSESLPSLSSIFKPEEFFGMSAYEESLVSILCCIVD